MHLKILGSIVAGDFIKTFNEKVFMSVYDITTIVVIFLGFLIFKYYLPSYVRKKGENFATKEDFKSILEQVKKTTTITENIKKDLAEISWINQQKWFLKEKYYSKLLESLYLLKKSLNERLDFYNLPGSEHDSTISEDKFFILQREIGREAIDKIFLLHGPAEIVLSEKAIKALEKFYKESWLANEHAFNNEDYLRDMLDTVCNTYDLILNEARLELKCQ